VGIESAFYSHLSSDDDVLELVGANIYFGVAAQCGSASRIVVTLISQDRFDHLNASSGLVRTRMQVDCYARDTPATAARIAESVRMSLHGFRGLMGAEDLDVRWSTLESMRYTHEPPRDGQSFGLHRYSQDWSITHAEPIPEFS
jgi:hypothetical protein